MVAKIVSADSSAESVRILERLHREENNCTRGNDEPIPKYITILVSHGQAYPSMVDS